MTNVKKILAHNLKQNRRKLKITQPELAERAKMSTQYLAMIEIARKFPTADMLERLAAALGIHPHELFTVSDLPEMAVAQMQRAVLEGIDKKLEKLEGMDKKLDKLEQAVERVLEKTASVL